MKPARRGDLVIRDENIVSNLYEWWGYGPDGSGDRPRITGEYRTGLALVIEDNFEHGGNGSKILTSDGQIGWTYTAYLYAVK